MNPIQQKRLIKKCIQQDRLSQRVLFEQYKGAMFSTAFRMTNDFDAAHDILQEAFIKVFQHLSTFKGTGSLASWIKTIVVRVAMKHLKGLHLHVELDDNQNVDFIVFDENLTGELLDELVRMLPDKSRVVFNLIEVEGYSHKEVSAMLGIAIGTSKSQLNYAKGILKTQLMNRGYEQFKKG